MNNWQQRFYKSKKWKLVRAYVIARDKYICGLCGEIIIESPEIHHKIELTEQNYIDPSISLNPDLLETLHHACHDARHGRFGGTEKDVIVDAELNIDYSRR